MKLMFAIYTVGNSYLITNYNYFTSNSEGALHDHEHNELRVTRFERDNLEESSVECAICLCKIEDGEEVRELNCDHLFHRACLDRWMNCGRAPHDHEHNELRVTRFEHDNSEESSVECAICLCKIEDGEEVRELNCDHLFHRACLDRWMNCGRMTCPLCRNHLIKQTQLSLSLIIINK
ncbi:hypothetical protein H5410_025208 [Solanum commersonii]|uniref:RING-type domain-containing protein n=1 Tax=Solanum commersonii TaxID=4109 RepID=A0A9J5YXA9_SOLCO|nr:hypothetical protein H5410_025208 [Solanum commersonii]